MKINHMFNDNLFFDNDFFDDELEEFTLNRYYSKNKDDCINEEDFYPPYDNRVLKSDIDDIDGGDNFADYCEYIFKLLEEEEYYDN